MYWVGRCDVTSPNGVDTTMGVPLGGFSFTRFTSFHCRLLWQDSQDKPVVTLLQGQSKRDSIKKPIPSDSPNSSEKRPGKLGRRI